MMSKHTLLSLFAIAYAGVANAQSSATTALEPLASKHFTWPNIPYQVTGDQGGIRGPQFGFNLCNSTTENQNSDCQTMFLNNLVDFCMWSSSQPDDTIGESEAREVAWCTSPGHGTRVIPPGAITGAQWLYATNYLQVVGYIDQSMINLDPTDEGGELDPHGADEQGNPLGGIVFTNGFGMNSASFQSLVQSGGSFTANTTYTQVIEWVDFVGGGIFCLKMCNPDDPNAAELCQHIYDEIGCAYNAVADYASINGTFSVCDSDDMSPPGVYVGADGHTTTWFQSGTPPVPPYTPTQVASSNCVTYSSSQLFKAAATDSVFSGLTSSAASTTGTAKATGSSGSGASGSSSRSGSAASGSATGSGALATFNMGATPFVAGTLLTTLATMMMMLA